MGGQAAGWESFTKFREESDAPVDSWGDDVKR